MKGLGLFKASEHSTGIIMEGHMKVSYIDAALAPPPPEQPFTTADDTLQTLREMRPGESLEIWPAADETLRGVRTSFTRISKREDILIAIHPADSGRAIKVTRLR